MVRVTKLELHRTISDIMKKGDLDQLTTKKIRMLCEQKYNVDLTSRKEEIDRIVMAFVTKQSGNGQNIENDKNDVSGGESDSGESEEESSGSSSTSGSESCSDSECADSSDAEPKKPTFKEQTSPKPVSVPKKVAIKNTSSKKNSSQPTKKVAVASPSAKNVKQGNTSNTSKKAELDDAAYARQLQAEEWNFRQRTSRKLFRAAPSKKDINNEQTKKKRASPFMKKCLLSPALGEVVGSYEMSRPDVVQKMWSVVRERNLFDPSNKQYAICDDQLMEIFGKKRIRLIGMMKYLKKHIKDKDAE